MNILFCNIFLLLSQEVDVNKGKTAPPSHNTLPALNGANAGPKPSPGTDAKNTNVKDNEGSDPNKNTVDVNKDNNWETDSNTTVGPDNKPPADPNKTTASYYTKPPASPDNNSNT